MVAPSPVVEEPDEETSSIAPGARGRSIKRVCQDAIAGLKKEHGRVPSFDEVWTSILPMYEEYMRKKRMQDTTARAKWTGIVRHLLAS